MDTSLDGAGRDALVAIKASIETLRGLVRDAQWYHGEEATARECVGLLSKLGDLCREEGALGERHKTSLGEVLRSVGRSVGGLLVSYATCACLSTLGYTQKDLGS